VCELLALGEREFQRSLPGIIEGLHGQRKACGPARQQTKSCYSRLLFLLSRCSRLLTGEEGGSDGVAGAPPGVTAAAAAAAPSDAQQLAGLRTRSAIMGASSSSTGSAFAAASCLNAKLQQLLQCDDACSLAAAGHSTAAAEVGGAGGGTGVGQRSSCHSEEPAAAVEASPHKAKARRKSAFGAFVCAGGGVCVCVGGGGQQ
jgi:hypothetical protein